VIEIIDDSSRFAVKRHSAHAQASETPVMSRKPLFSAVFDRSAGERDIDLSLDRFPANMVVHAAAVERWVVAAV
jgi:hypothetical protein